LVATPKDVTDLAAVMFIYEFAVVGAVTAGLAGENVTYLSAEPSRQGAEIAHKYTGVVEAT